MNFSLLSVMEFPHYIVASAILFVVILSIISSTVKYFVKYTLYHLYMVAIFALALIPCSLRPGSAENIVVGRYMYYGSKFVWWLFGFDIVGEGTENIDNIKAPCVFMCNHQSSLDALVIAKYAPKPTGSLAKKSLLYVPFFGWASWMAGTVFIERKSHTAVEVMKKLVGEIKRKKTNIWIFPEGTRCQNDSMLPFKKGGFHLAIQAQIPIVPVVIGNCRNFLDIPNKIFESGTLRVKILPPIDTTGLTNDDATSLAEKCWDIMLDEYYKISDKYKDDYIAMKPLPEQSKNK